MCARVCVCDAGPQTGTQQGQRSGQQRCTAPPEWALRPPPRCALAHSVPTRLQSCTPAAHCGLAGAQLARALGGLCATPLERPGTHAGRPATLPALGAHPHAPAAPPAPAPAPGPTPGGPATCLWHREGQPHGLLQRAAREGGGTRRVTPGAAPAGGVTAAGLKAPRRGGQARASGRADEGGSRTRRSGLPPPAHLPQVVVGVLPQDDHASLVHGAAVHRAAGGAGGSTGAGRLDPPRCCHATALPRRHACDRRGPGSLATPAAGAATRGAPSHRKMQSFGGKTIWLPPHSARTNASSSVQ